MTTTHKGKSIKELVNSRISGKIYRREACVTNSSNFKPSLQDIAESILLKHERGEEVEQLFMNKSKKIEEINNAIVNNSIQNSNPVPNRVRTPTILQKLNPTKDMRKSAYVAVAEAQVSIAKETVGIVEMKKVQIKQAQSQEAAPSNGFGRVPKFLKSY